MSLEVHVYEVVFGPAEVDHQHRENRSKAHFGRALARRRRDIDRSAGNYRVLSEVIKDNNCAREFDRSYGVVWLIREQG